MNIINTLNNKFKNLDYKTKKIMHIGLIVSFILCLISTSFLFTYETFYSIPTLFYTGISLFKTSLMFACSFLIGGISFDTIKNEIGL